MNAIDETKLNGLQKQIHTVEKKFLKQLTPFKIGDTVRVFVKIVEGKRERLQAFEGIVIGIKNSGIRKTFKVRKVSFGIGVEKTFPFNSPVIDRVEVVKRGKVRRAKLYYLRDRVGKRAQVKLLDTSAERARQKAIEAEEKEKARQQKLEAEAKAETSENTEAESNEETAETSSEKVEE